MKSFKLLLSVLALAAFAAAPVLRAVDAPAAPAAGSGAHKGPRDGERLKMLTEKLGLTSDQVAKVKSIIQDEKAAMKTLKDDVSTDKKAMQEKRMEIMKSHAEQIAAVLTPEQKAKFKAMREERRGPGKPAAAPAAPAN